MLPDLPSESSRLFVEKPFLECPKLNGHSWIAIFYIPLRVMLACLFQTSSACLAKTHASPDCPVLPHENVKSKPSFQEVSFFGEVGLVPSLLTYRIISSQEERWKEVWVGKRNSLPKALHWTGKFSLFLAIQRSWLASPPRTPNASFLVIILLSSFFPFPLRFCQCFSLILRRVWCPSSTLQASPRDRERGLGGFQVYGPL